MTHIIERLALRRPIYKRTATYGQFGRQEFPWEEVGGVGRLTAVMNR